MRAILTCPRAQVEAPRGGLDPVWGTHRAAVDESAVGEAAVALAAELDLVGTLEEQGLLEVASLLIHVGYAVLAVVGDVLGGLSGHQAQEGQLDGDISRVGALASILELHGPERVGDERPCGTPSSWPSCPKSAKNFYLIKLKRGASLIHGHPRT